MTVQLYLTHCSIALVALALTTLFQVGLLKWARHNFDFFFMVKKTHVRNFLVLRVFQLILLALIAWAVRSFLIKDFLSSALRPQVILIHIGFWLVIPYLLYFANYRWEFRNKNFCR
ncbi:MAG: hypothetical protein WCW66_04055 [Patescibacteria group bacterium]|jgi:hypothetical protein